MFFQFLIIFNFLLLSIISASGITEGHTVVYSKQSPFGLVEVVRDPLGELLICEDKDYSQTHSVIHLGDPTFIGAKYADLSTASFCIANNLENVLLFGLGGGEFFSYLTNYFPNTHVDVVEINPVMFDIVKNFREIKVDDKKVNFIEADAFKYVDHMSKSYDLIFWDIYFFTPTIADQYQHLFEKIKRNLKEGGVFVLNAVMYELPRTIIQDMFNNFDNITAADTDQGNIVFMCYQGHAKTKEELKSIANKMQAQYNFRYPLPNIFREVNLLTTKQEKTAWLNKFP